MITRIHRNVYKFIFFIIVISILSIFPSIQAQVPTIDNLTISSSTGVNSLNADIICDYLLSGSSITSATSWYRNGQPIMNYYLPFEGNNPSALQDWSGNNIPLSTVGNVNLITNNGHDNSGAIALDGASYINSSSGFPTSSSYTTCAWIKQTSVGGYSFIFGSNNASAPGHGFRMTFDGRLTAGHNNNWRIAETNQRYAFLPNNWYFVACTFDNLTGEMIIYKNGVPLDTGYVTGSALNVTDSTVQIGGLNGSATFIGEIDDARIYDYALSRDQIIALYDSNGKDIIVAIENNIGDIWEARVTPFSSTEAGSTAISNDIEIIATTPLFTSSPVISGIPGKKYKYSAAADGGPYPIFSLISGPAGMTIDSASGFLSWLPEFTGNFDVSISATNSEGIDIQNFTINVVPPSVGISNPQLVALGNGNLEASHTNTLNTTSSATAWIKNGEPFMDLYMPFEGGSEYSKEDYSGNGYEAMPIGNPVWTPDGGHDGNGAYEFDGESFLLAGSIFPLHSSYTKTIWIYHTVSGEFHHILSGWDHSTDVAGGHGMRVSYDNRLSAGQNGDWRMVQTDPGTIQLNQWYFAALTFDYSSGMMILYVNGVAVDSTVVPSYKLDVTDPGVLIGATQGAFAWKGKLDDARIYNKVLSPEQIAAMYSVNGDNIIVANETTDGDIWQTEVTGFSSVEASIPYASNQLLIGATNQPPTLTTIGPQSIDEGSTLNIPVFASDPDAVFPNISAAPIPTNASFTDNNDGTGNFTFTPDFDQQGVFDITFIASDGIDSDSEIVTITVNNVNRAPMLTTIDDQMIPEGSVLNMLITATDPDNDSLIFSTDVLEENMSFTDNYDGTASFSFAPSFLQAGIYNIWFYVTDNSALIDSQVVQVVVTDVPQNALWTATFQSTGTVVGTAVNQAKVIIGVQSYPDLVSASPPAPEYSTNIQLIASDNSGPYYKDIRAIGEDCYFWTLDLDPHGNTGNPSISQCATISWDPSEFSPDYNYVLREGLDPAGPVVIADMRLTTSYQVCDIQTSRYYTVHWESPGCSGTIWSTLSLSTGWNLVSLPVAPSVSALTELIPTAEVAYAFDNTYSEVTDLYPCNGYWIKVPADVNILLSGSEVTDCSNSLSEGWNLVGTPNCAAIPQSTPGGTIQSLFSYDGGYSPVTNSTQGFGLWVEINANSTVDINCASPVSTQSNPIVIAKPTNDLFKITASRPVNGMISSTSVEIGAAAVKSIIHNPPVAPEQSVTLKLYRENWDGPYYRDLQESNSTESVWILAVNPIGTETTLSEKSAVLSWTEIVKGDDNYTLYEGIGIDKKVLVDDMHAITSLEISGNKQDQFFTIVRTNKTTDNIPQDFVLNQNYPNPFNPSTEISFSIPKAQQVRIEIFNVIGQRITTLMNGLQEAGSHSVYWNGTDNSGNSVSSGIYLYRLSSDSYTDTKKMVLLK